MSRTFFSHVFFWPVIITKFVSKTYGGIELGTVNRYFYYDYTSPPKECPELFFPRHFLLRLVSRIIFVSRILRSLSHGSSERNFYFYYTDTPGECPELFLIKNMIQNGFETDLLTCLIMNRQG